MNFDINNYCERLKAELLSAFGKRLIYVNEKVNGEMSKIHMRKA